MLFLKPLLPITVITRKAYGGAYDNNPNTLSRHSCNGLSRDRGNGCKGAAEIIFRKEIKEANDGPKWKEKEAEYAFC